MLRRPTVPALAAWLAFAAWAAAPSLAQQSPPAAPPQERAPQERAGELAREAIEKLMQALALVIENLPQYAMPEINERGDIIIRRLNPPPRVEREREPAPENPDETRT